MSENTMGTVTALVSNREVIVNLGTNHGIREGSLLLVMDRDFQEILDPASSEVIGFARAVKVPMKVIDVSSNMSLAQTYRTRKVNTGGNAVNVSGLFSPPRWEEVDETIKFSGDATKITPSSHTIEVGDRVQEVEFEDESNIPSVILSDSGNP